MAGDDLARPLDIGQVGAEMRVERRRNADQNGVDFRKTRKVGCRRETSALDGRADLGRGYVTQIALAREQRIRLGGIDVETDD